MSSSDPPTLTPDSQPSLSSVWSCHCNGPVKDIQISPHGVVAVSTENCVNLYAGAPNFGTSQELSVAPATLTAYKFSANGGDLIAGSSDGRLRWWEVPRGEEACSTQFPLLKAEDTGLDDTGGVNPAISSIACAKEGDLVAAAGGRTICIFASGGVHIHTIGPLADTILGLEWRTNGELAVNVGIAICVFTVDEKTVTPGAQYAADGGGLTVLASAPSGKMLAAGCTNGSVRIWDLGSEAEGKISVHIKGFLNSPDTAEQQVKCLAWDERGHFLATAGGSDVIVWDMEDAASEEGKDNSIVCYGHGQNAKITALKFQPNGKLLATGGDDCQVALFDSSNFNSNGMVGGLVGSIVSVRVGHEAEGSSITALAWHPSGLILAGTTQGRVDAFEVAQAEPEIASSLSTDLDKPFLIKRDVAGVGRQQLSNMPPHPQPQPHRGRNNHRQPQAGWGGEPLITSRTDDSSEKQNMGFGNRRRAANGGRQLMDPMSAGRSRPTKNRAKTIFHEINSIKHSRMGGRPPYPDGQQQQPPHQQPPSQPPPQQQQGSWMMPPMVGWPNPYGPQVPYPQMQYGMPQGGMPNSPMPPYNQPPVSQPSEVTRESTQPGGGTPNQMPRGPAQNPQQQQQQQQPGLYPMGYVPYPHYRMPYPSPYGYYPMGQHMQMQDDAMPPQPPPSYGAPTGPPAPQITSARSAARDFPRPISSTDLNEDAASKSSEATNNGVNSMAPVTPSESSVSGYDHEGGRALQTLYIGNLASGVDENLLMQYFSSFGPIMNIQVIRDRDTRLSRGFAFVTYNHPVYAQMAMQHMDTMQLFGPFEGRRLKVSFSNRR